MFNFSCEKRKLSFFIFLITLFKFSLLFKSNKFKFLQRCEDMLTCNSCVNLGDYCGWCYSDGLCKSGNTISPSQIGTCKYFEWETSNCRVKNCEEYYNPLACVTQSDCIWCGDSNTSSFNKGKCFSKNKKLSLKCSKVYELHDYAKFPKEFKNKIRNADFNNELEKLSDIDSDSAEIKAINQVEIIKYNKLIKKMDLWYKTKNIIQVDPYNSISNPAGIFKYQTLDSLSQSMHSKNNSIYFNPSTVNNNLPDISSFNKLSLAAKKEMVELSKVLATNQLKLMFNFNEISNPTLNNNININSIRSYYLLLEKIAKDKWTNYLKSKKITIKSIYDLLKIENKKIYSNYTSIIQRQNKLSIMYPFKYNSEKISSIQFPYNTWNRLPGTNVTLKAYLNTTVIILQKIRLSGQGNNFESVFFNNEEDINSLSTVKINKPFSQIDMNNFFARQLSPGIHKLYLAYKTDLKINKNKDSNLILTNTLEFPYTPADSLKIKKGIFLLDYYQAKKKVMFYVKELFQELDVAPINSESRFNYLIFYNVNSGSKRQKNIFFRLNIKNKNGIEHKETITSNSIYIPSLNKVQNLGGISLVSLSVGQYNVDLCGQFIFEYEHSSLTEELNDQFYKDDNYSFNKTLSNITAKLKSDEGELDKKELANAMKELKLSKDKDTDKDKVSHKNFNSTSLNNTDPHGNKTTDQYHNKDKDKIHKKKKPKKKPNKTRINLNYTDDNDINDSMILDEINFIEKDYRLFKSDKEDPIKKKKKPKKKPPHTNSTISNANPHVNSTAINGSTKFHPNNITDKKTIKAINTTEYAAKPQGNEHELEDYLLKLNKFSTNNIESLEKVKNNLLLYDKIAQTLKTTDKISINARYLHEIGEISIFRLPITSLIYTTSFKDIFYFRGNNELNEIPSMKKTIKLTSEKNVIIHINIILTFEKSRNFEFRLYINGKDDCDSLMTSKNQRIINTSTTSIEKLQAGEYHFELLYLTDSNGYANMSHNDWDIISMNILLLEVD